MGEIAKVEIQAFEDNRFQKQLKDLGTFELPVNPEKLSQSLKVVYDKKQANGSQGNDSEFKIIEPEKLVLNFTIDGTGVVPVKGKAGVFHRDVVGQVEKFLKIAYFINGKIHKPNFLRVLWGNASFGNQNCFDCTLTDLNIDYTLFAPDGKPLRAQLKAEFIRYVETKRRVREQGNTSPDVTHLRTVTAEKTLPLMVAEVYGDQSYYLQVAKANGLVNFRSLKTNTDLRFPPINKTVI